jgi:hypothetical protein
MPEPKEKTENVERAPIIEPFPEPQTMPSGWDLSGLVADPLPKSTSPTKQNVDNDNK